MERSAMFGRHSALCQPSCSSRHHRTPADRVTTCVATPVKPPTAKVAKRYGCCSVTFDRICARASGPSRYVKVWTRLLPVHVVKCYLMERSCSPVFCLRPS